MEKHTNESNLNAAFERESVISVSVCLVVCCFDVSLVPFKCLPGWYVCRLQRAVKKELLTNKIHIVISRDMLDQIKSLNVFPLKV